MGNVAKAGSNMGQKKRMFISFSGGRTSAFMTWMLWHDLDHEEWDIVVVFANTGQEHESTLRFVRQFEQVFGIPVIWIEAVVDQRPGKGLTHKQVTFETASRDGRPFEQMIAKYGVPNMSRPFCSRYLKGDAIRRFIKSIGWKEGTYKTAIGIRADEWDRMSEGAMARGVIYPLVRMKITKADVLTWWSNRSFDLTIKEHQGNCKWCWKKSLRKHLTLIRENPEYFDFPRRMEKEYGHVKRVGITTDEKIVFFRNHMSVEDLFELAKQPLDKFTEEEFEMSNGCSESCEVDFG